MLAAAKDLALWFDIANDTVKPPLYLGGILHDLPLETYFKPLQENVRASFAHLISVLKTFRTEYPDYFTRYAGAGAPRRFRIHLSWPAEGNGPWGDLTFGSDYRLASNRDDLRSVFIEALLDTDLDRFRRCPVCQHFFYRIRSDNKGDGCSDDCNNTLRQQRWRSNKAKQPRKFKAKQSPKLKLVR